MKTAPPLDAEMDREEASAKTPRRQRSRGKDWFYVWGLDGRAVNAFWPQLPTLVEIAPTERQLKVIESRTASLENAIAEEKPTRQVVAALKRDVRQERQERVKVASECQALTFERDNARDEALAVARERDRALQEAQRIIHENQRAPIMLGCTGCGQRIDLATWRCDDCRAREHEAAGHSMFDVNLESHSAHTVSVTNRFTSNIESEDTVLRPCAGGCGTPTHRGWTCKPCRDRSTDSLHISDCTTQGPGQETLHGR